MRSILFLIYVVSLFCQTEKTVVAEGEYIGAVAPSIGYKKAREAAINNAIEKVAGINVTSTTSLFKKEVSDELIESYTNYFTTFTNATVKGVKRLSKKMVPLEEDLLQFIIKAEITLVVDEVGPDPSFTVKAELNKPAFIEGDALQIDVRTSKDAYLTVLNITQKNDVLILLPNPLVKMNFIKEGSELSIPSHSDMQKGIVFETENETGMKSVSEIVIVIATKERIPIIAEEHSSGFMAVTRNSFQEWISKIPLSMRAMDTKIYEIFNK